MECKTLKGKDKLRELNSERVEKINSFFDKLTELCNDFYEQVFDNEDFKDKQLEISGFVKSAKPKDFEE